MQTGTSNLIKVYSSESNRGSNFLCTKNLKKWEEENGQEKQYDGRSYLWSLFSDLNPVYVVGQLERGNKDNTLHLQFFVNFKKARISKLKDYDNSLHIELVRVNNGADLYCMKEETRVDGPWEFGNKPVHYRYREKKKDKIDWEDIWEKACKGEIKEIQPSIRVMQYGKLKNIEKDNMKFKEDCEHLRGIWIYGNVGTGKSLWVRKNFKRTDLYPKLCNKWWDGYQGQKYVVMDDLMPIHNVLAQQLKIWADRYAVILEIKGGAVVDNYEWFIITTQYTVYDIFKDKEGKTDYETVDAIERRYAIFQIDEIVDKEFKDLDLSKLYV